MENKWYDVFKTKTFWGKVALLAGGFLGGSMTAVELLTGFIGLF